MTRGLKKPKKSQDWGHCHPGDEQEISTQVWGRVPVKPLMPCCCPWTPPREPKFTCHEETYAAKTCVRIGHGAAVLRGSVWSTPTALVTAQAWEEGSVKSTFLLLVTNPSLVECLLGCCLPQFLADGIPWHGIAVTQITLDALELDCATEQPWKLCRDSGFGGNKGKMEEQSGKINSDLVASSFYLHKLKKVAQD